MKAIDEERFKGNPGDDPIAHLKKFEKELKLKYSLTRLLLDWFLNSPLGTFDSWYYINAAFKERYGPPSIMSYTRELIFCFKQRSDEILIHAWERFRELMI
jgi:hypothetical protein